VEDPARRFSGRVEAYARGRPTYPRALLGLLERALGLARSWVVADVGSGTGNLSALFLAHGNRVLAVEPNAEMRAAAERRFAAEPRFTSVSGRAEATTLPDACADLVVAGQAFHWFDVETARAELARVLRPPRRVALLWNVRDETATPFARAYERLLREQGTDYRPGFHGHADEEAIRRFLAPSEARVATLPNAQELDLEELRARAVSSSYLPAPGTAGHAPMLRALQALFVEHARAGRVRLGYETRIYSGELGS
jgi:SAM-dependent methyltransferase